MQLPFVERLAVLQSTLLIILLLGKTLSYIQNMILYPRRTIVCQHPIIKEVMYMWQIAIFIVQIAIIIAALALIIPVRYIKSEYFEERITTLEWLGTLGKRNRERLDDMLLTRERTALLLEKIKQQQEQPDQMHRFWDDSGALMKHAALVDTPSPWKLVDGKSADQQPDKEHGSDDDDATKDATK